MTYVNRIPGLAWKRRAVASFLDPLGGRAGRSPAMGALTWKRRALKCTIAWLVGVPLVASALDIPQPRLPTIELRAGMHRLATEVASTPAQRQVGMMMRPTMASHEAMLFVFEEPGVQCFWMKNTLVPLSAAFVDDDGRIVNIADMQPLSEQSHCSQRPVRYVLEVNQGWFARRGVGPGFKLSGPPFSAAR